MVTKPEPTGLELLRKPFPPNLISQLPKPTRAQTDAVKADFKAGIRCEICGAWHHPKVVHLDYVGHAALTDRLLDCDDQWNWEPMAHDERGAPALDANGGMWIKLTVCGVTRLGYGHPDGKKGGDAIKEAIGDALRNAAMRFGAALDLWHKGQLHADESQEQASAPAEKQDDPFQDAPMDDETLTRKFQDALIAIEQSNTPDELDAVRTNKITPIWKQLAKPEQEVLGKAGAVRSENLRKGKAA